MNKCIDVKIGMIGCGKVGMTLGAYFKKNGYCVQGFASRRYESALKASRLTNTRAYPDICHLAKDSDMIFITTPDDQIANVWNKFAGCGLENRIICHTSGSLSSGVFTGITEHGAFGYSIHPMYAFSSAGGAAAGLEKAYFTIEGPKERIEFVRSFFAKMGNKTLVIDGSKKALYHLANVMVSNLVLALLSIGSTCMQQAGVEQDRIMDALMPLILNNIHNVAENGLVDSLTGPVERNDTKTIARHLLSIPRNFGTMYAGLSLELVRLAQQKHPGKDYNKMLSQFKEYIKDQEG